MAERSLIDVLLVSPGTTAGWRRVDADFAQLLRELGLTVATATTAFPIARQLRRTMPLTDLVEAAAMRRTTSTRSPVGIGRVLAVPGLAINRSQSSS